MYGWQQLKGTQSYWWPTLDYHVTHIFVHISILHCPQGPKCALIPYQRARTSRESF